MKSYYVDTCIWLNLFQREGDESKGVPYWKLALEFIRDIIFSKYAEIVYSRFILNELKYRLTKDKFKEFLIWSAEENFREVKISDQDYNFARELESVLEYSIGFYDCLHIAICKRCGFILVTRDRKLIEKCRKYIKIGKPEGFKIHPAFF